jgi:transposase
MTGHTPMLKVARLDVISSGARRRWSLDEKQRIVAESYAAPRQVSATARRNGLSASQLFTWRRLARDGRLEEADREPTFAPVPRLVPVQLTPAAAESGRSIEAPVAMPARKRRGLMEIELGDGKRVSVDENVDAEALGRVLDVLSRR